MALAVGVVFLSMWTPAILAHGELNGTRIESHFFSGVNDVVVGVSQKSSTEILSDGGFLKFSIGREAFPIVQSDIEDIALKKIRDNLISKDIKVERSSQSVGTYYLTNENENPNTVFLLLNITHWNKENFSPKLDHDILAIDIKYKRNKEGLSHSGAVLPKPMEKILPTILISVPDDKEKLSQSLSETLQKILVDKIVSKIDCAHGVGCGG